MYYREIEDDLFNYYGRYYLAHCISSDYKLGAGIAYEFSRRYDMRRKLLFHGKGVYPDCMMLDGVFNLVTKKYYFHKPTYYDLEQALLKMKEQCLTYRVRKVAMPKIGCGLDRLHWSKVRKMIQTIFSDTDIEILVCFQENTYRREF